MARQSSGVGEEPGLIQTTDKEPAEAADLPASPAMDEPALQRSVALWLQAKTYGGPTATPGNMVEVEHTASLFGRFCLRGQGREARSSRMWV